MYSIVIAIIFYIFGLWLFRKEWIKDPAARNMWNVLSAILLMVMAIAVTLVWLSVVLL
jgi:hypothetical protein